MNKQERKGLSLNQLANISQLLFAGYIFLAGAAALNSDAKAATTDSGHTRGSAFLTEHGPIKAIVGGITERSGHPDPDNEPVTNIVTLYGAAGTIQAIYELRRRNKK